ncbi:MAG: hypothetical protein LC745_09150 [Planctomycetia bacterium]|nr:hypothetical protein [Planctomycetia bacterium]
MNIDNVRSMTRLPFHPFLVRTASGESYAVSQPELYWIDPDGEVMLVKDKTQGVVLIDLDHISECVREPTKGRGKKSV